ncbi:MAG: TlpA family protein disulfide reductase [Chitinophagaceae bacterium]
MMKIMMIGLGLMMMGNFAYAQSANSTKASEKGNASTSSKTSSAPPKAKNTSEKPLAQPGAALPSFAFLTSDEKVYFDSNLRKNTPVILVLFNPSCGHCMEVAISMKSRINELAGADIVFLTGNNLLAELPSFIQQTRFHDMPNVYVGIDHSDVSKSLFEYNGIPQIMVYNQQHILLKTYYKQMELDEIVRLIRSE